MMEGMIETKWTTSHDPYAMFHLCKRFMRQHPRKARLFVVACCRRIWHLLTDERSRAAVITAAMYADALVGEDQLVAAEQAGRAACEEARIVKGEVDVFAALSAQTAAADSAALEADCNIYAFAAAGDTIDQPGPEKAAQADLLRCVLGPPPFRHVAIDPSVLRWNDYTVVRLAEPMYLKGVFDHMAVLGDALEEAGCNDARILAHCRQSSPHTRGCWVVDLLTGRM
jgi:hypothetical protein